MRPSVHPEQVTHRIRGQDASQHKNQYCDQRTHRQPAESADSVTACTAASQRTSITHQQPAESKKPGRKARTGKGHMTEQHVTEAGTRHETAKEPNAPPRIARLPLEQAAH